MPHEHDPSYRALENVVVLTGLSYAPGATFAWRGWPRAEWAHKVEGANDSGRSILDYYRERRHGVMPPSPFDGERLFLPATSLHSAGSRHSAPRRFQGYVSDPAPNMPTCLMGDPSLIVPRGYPVPDDRVAAFVGWPEPSALLRPISQAAEAVTEYFREHASHPKLRPSPWCNFTNSLHVPDLPPLARSEPNYVAPRALAPRAAKQTRSRVAAW
jgi:hypothetical protein